VTAAMAPTATWWMVLAAVLFGIGTLGVMTRRNPLVVFMSIELMLNAVNLTFVALASRLGDVAGQTAVSIMRRRAETTVDDLSGLKG
jgi:NADH-quinone oxidoreductase subunit K